MGARVERKAVAEQESEERVFVLYRNGLNGCWRYVSYEPSIIKPASKLPGKDT
jgi:hypothetical protein